MMAKWMIKSFVFLQMIVIQEMPDNSLADLPANLIKQIEFHFNNYKALKKPGSTKVTHWGDVEEAKEGIRESIKRWNER